MARRALWICETRTTETVRKCSAGVDDRISSTRNGSAVNACGIANARVKRCRKVAPPVKRRTSNRNLRGERLKNVGLARAISKLGYCSRSRAAELIAAGRVKWNGTIRRDPETPVHLEKSCIEIDGQSVARSSKIYLALNKPRGVVTTAADEKGRKTVYSLLPQNLPWLAPVGRLDKASEGLLLLTNDSEWAAKITSPETRLDKTYHVQINAIVDETLLRKLLNGIRASDGEFLRVKNAQVLRQGEHNSWLEIILDEGKNRHIRRMLEALKIEVLRLVRVAIGPLALGDLAKGATRMLEEKERQAMDRAIQL
ncbi:MAG TPA: pseudouridine synthase [Candidatus Polarisedimenticolia bacterium]|nr:pseudouridine synthase [Candidatus Polarisedimenticolia bacterium]